MIEGYENRDVMAGRKKVWPAVVIVKGIPGHPEGAIRYPRPEQREQWQKQGICRTAPEHDRRTAPKAVASAMTSDEMVRPAMKKAGVRKKTKRIR